MPKWYQLTFTGLELRGLWIRATAGDTSSDTLLDQAAENALDKIYRAEKGMPKKATPPPAAGYGRGPDIVVGKKAS